MYTGSQPTGDLSPSTRRYKLPLLSARPAVTFPAEERHRPSAGIKLYCLVTEAYACEQLAQGCYLEADQPRFERSTVKPHWSLTLSRHVNRSRSYVKVPGHRRKSSLFWLKVKVNLGNRFRQPDRKPDLNWKLCI